MASNQAIICPHTPRQRLAVKETCRILAAVFLSLLLPLSFLLLARLSIALHLLSMTSDNNVTHPQFFSFLTNFFSHCDTTSILTFLLSLVAFSAFVHCLTGTNPALLIGERRRLNAGWFLLFLIQTCLNLGIWGTIDAEINSLEVSDSVLVRRFLLALGLHEMMIFWSENAVKPVVDEVVFGFPGESFTSLTERVVLAVAFGNLWWHRLREEAEALVLLPGITAELGMDVWAAVDFGWWLYYLTAAVGAVRGVRGFVWVLTWIFKCLRFKNENNNATCKAGCL